MPLGEAGNGEKEDLSADNTLNYGAPAEDRTQADLGLILAELQNVNRRIERLELQQPVLPTINTQEIGPPPRVRATLHSRECQDTEGPVSSAPKLSSPDVSEFHDIQEKFNIIKASVEKVILPTQLKLHDSRSGIKREDQPILNVVGKCGRYVETALKLISEGDEGKQVDIGQIAIVLVANLRFLQDEFAALLVKGRFDNNTSQLFRSLQKNTSGFDEQSLQNVRVAAELSSIANRFQPPSQNRGGYRGGYRGRGRDRTDRDVFQSLCGSSFPRFKGPPTQHRDKDQEES